MIKVFVLHYTPLVERKKFQLEQLSRHGIDAEFIESYDKEVLTQDDKNRFQHCTNLPAMSLLLKHAEAFKEVYLKYDFALILEDDAVLSNNFMETLQKYMSCLPTDWDVLFVGCGDNMHVPSRFLHPNINLYLKSNDYPGSTRGTDAYIINKKCAIKIMNRINTPGYKICNDAADWWLNNEFRESKSRVYWAEPTIVVQGSVNGLFKSSIDVR